MRFADEFDAGFGWVCDEFLQRASHALAVDGRVWLVDPVDAPGIDERIRALGAPAGVIQLLDRHGRDSVAIAERLAAPVVPAYAGGAATPFELVPVVRRRWWREVALWWPERRVLVAADALGTANYFRAGGERLGVHPILRLFPPRRLGALAPERILVGHGEGVHDRAAEALEEALRTARRRAPAVYAAGLRRRRRT